MSTTAGFGEIRRIREPIECLTACRASSTSPNRAGWMAWLEFQIIEIGESKVISVSAISARSRSARSSLAWTSSTQCKRREKPFQNRAISIGKIFRNHQRFGTNRFDPPPESPRMPTISSSSSRDEPHRRLKTSRRFQPP